jgi:probable HAF family extracellular repeat protein
MHTVHRVRVVGHVFTMFVSFGMMTSAVSGASFQSLGYLPGGTFLSSSAYAVSADGTTVVGTSQSSNGLEAFRWTARSGMIGLGDLPGGGFRSVAYGVSADGSVIVGQAQPDNVLIVASSPIVSGGDVTRVP